MTGPDDGSSMPVRVGLADLCSDRTGSHSPCSLAAEFIAYGLGESGVRPVPIADPEPEQLLGLAAAGRCLRHTLVRREAVASVVADGVEDAGVQAVVALSSDALSTAGLMLAAARLGGCRYVVLLPVLAAGRTEDDHAMAALAETLGFAVEGACAAGLSRSALAAAAARTVDAAVASPPPARTLDSAALTTGAALLAALGASPDAAIHLAALGTAGGVACDLEHLVGIMGQTPRMWRRPSDAFGARNGLSDTLAALAEEGLPTGAAVNAGGFSYWVRGSLAPDGAVACVDTLLPLTASAAIFGDECSACAWVEQHSGIDDRAVVVSGQGPMGAPGMRELTQLAQVVRQSPDARVSMLLTDGRLPHVPGVARISAVAPEGAAGGPLAAMVDGDTVDLDAAHGSLSTYPIRPPEAAPRAPRRQADGLDLYRRSTRAARAGAVTVYSVKQRLTRVPGAAR